jgi:hypothetical protein
VTTRPAPAEDRIATGRVRARVAVVRVATPVRRVGRTRAARSRRTLAVFLLAFVAATAGFDLAADAVLPTLRDPEFGKKLSRANARMAATPGRPVVAVLGCSRVGMGVCPPAVEAGFAADRRPVVVNLSLLGSGPVLQLLAYDRLRRAGLRPAAVVIEYWPVLARAGDADREEHRIDPARLWPADVSAVRAAYRDPARLDRAVLAARLNPWTASRARLVALTVPKILPPAARADAGWAALDADGWIPGAAGPEPPRRHDQLRTYYAPRLHDTVVSAEADRAFRALVARCRTDGIPVALVWLPESSEFRRSYSPRSVAAAVGYWTRLTHDGNVPGIDLRAAVPDAYLPDGFHLSRAGAAVFGRHFAAALRRAFPNLGGEE